MHDLRFTAVTVEKPDDSSLPKSSAPTLGAWSRPSKMLQPGEVCREPTMDECRSCPRTLAYLNSPMAKSAARTACSPSLPCMPTPTFAATNIPTSFAPSPMPSETVPLW